MENWRTKDELCQMKRVRIGDIMKQFSEFFSLAVVRNICHEVQHDFEASKLFCQNFVNIP